MVRITIRTSDGKEIFECEEEPHVKENILAVETPDGKRHAYAPHFWKKVTVEEIEEK